jgi:hypothetical protein
VIVVAILDDGHEDALAVLAEDVGLDNVYALPAGVAGPWLGALVADGRAVSGRELLAQAVADRREAPMANPQ